MRQTRVKELLSELPDCAVGVIGDFCVDAYWDLDTGEPELSVETGKPTRAVRGHRYSLGGAGNIAANLTALGVGRVCAFAVMGDDLFGHEMARLLEELGVDCAGIVMQAEGWDTPVYAKPFRGNEEQQRIDFGRFNKPTPETWNVLLSNLRKALSASTLDALVVNQQLARGVCSGRFIGPLNDLSEEFSACTFIADSRDFPDSFRGMVLKANAHEAAACCGHEYELSSPVPAGELREYAKRLFRNSGKPVIITRGNRGILTFDGTVVGDIPGIDISGPTDSVGAGDTVSSALAACMGAGADCREAACLANLAAAVTVRKIARTGKAAPGEIIALFQNG